MAVNKVVKDLIIIGINTKLKNAKTYDDLMQIKDTIDKIAEHEIYLYFEMKKSKNLIEWSIYRTTKEAREGL